jgi:hypothetical protein
MMFDFIFLNLPQKKITIESIREFMMDTDTKRINFSTSHKEALKGSIEGSKAKINLPFADTIKPILETKLGTVLFSTKYGGVWRLIDSDTEFDTFQDFVKLYNDIVFLRDNLDLSIALSMNFNNETYTKIGSLEYQAKFQDNRTAEAELVNICKDWITELPFYKDSDYICAMPSSNPNERSLPMRIVNSLAGFKFKDISEDVFWIDKKKKIKDAGTIDEKLEILLESELKISCKLDGKTVILLDDLYMSGISMQFVAMKLKEAGAKRVFGLCIVKSRSNTTR